MSRVNDPTTLESGSQKDIKVDKEESKVDERNSGKSNSQRRPDIDVIRILVTWGILVFHTVIIYAPFMSYYTKVLPGWVQHWHVLITIGFVISMNVWNMPMFFFLSGISAFFALKKRTE